MRKLAATIAIGAVGASVYIRLIRPWQLRWGATDEEVKRAMPGDDIVSRPTFNATRAVTIGTPPERIWPWLVQMGHMRAGWYSYDWIDNFFVPSDVQLVPELQNLVVGDMRSVSLGGKLGFWVRAFEPNEWLLLTDRRDEMTWCFGLYPITGKETRLVTRYRMRYVWTRPRILYSVGLEFGDIIMMRKCMLGIKSRAESMGHQPEGKG